MIVGTGIDIIEVERIRKQLERDGTRFLETLFTAEEIEYCQTGSHRAAHARCFAGRFSAKEAFLKALGSGMRKGLKWKDVEIKNDELGKPEMILKGVALDRIQERGISSVHVSISHADTVAAAVVILESP